MGRGQAFHFIVIIINLLSINCQFVFETISVTLLGLDFEAVFKFDLPVSRFCLGWKISFQGIFRILTLCATVISRMSLCPNTPLCFKLYFRSLCEIVQRKIKEWPVFRSFLNYDMRLLKARLTLVPLYCRP